jgi:hypothetical protein
MGSRSGCGPGRATDALPERKRAELRRVISTKPGLHRYLRVTPGGLLRVDAAAVTAEARLDGKYLLRTCDPHLSAEDIALGYQQLAAIERAWRDMKHVIDLRPASPARGPHPRPRPALLAGPPAHPHHRDPHRADLAPAAPRPATLEAEQVGQRRVGQLHQPARDRGLAGRPRLDVDAPPDWLQRHRVAAGGHPGQQPLQRQPEEQLGAGEHLVGRHRLLAGPVGLCTHPCDGSRMVVGVWTSGSA